MTETTLDLLERAIANGSAELILACSTPHGALAQAEAILATDPTAARDFGNAVSVRRQREQAVDPTRAIAKLATCAEST